MKQAFALTGLMLLLLEESAWANADYGYFPAIELLAIPVLVAVFYGLGGGYRVLKARKGGLGKVIGVELAVGFIGLVLLLGTASPFGPFFLLLFLFLYLVFGLFRAARLLAWNRKRRGDTEIGRAARTIAPARMIAGALLIIALIPLSFVALPYLSYGREVIDRKDALLYMERKSALKNMATAQEDYYVQHGRYGARGDMGMSGWTVDPRVHVKIIIADDEKWVGIAWVDEPPNVVTYDSSQGGLLSP